DHRGGQQDCAKLHFRLVTFLEGAAVATPLTLMSSRCTDQRSIAPQLKWAAKPDARSRGVSVLIESIEPIECPGSLLVTRPGPLSKLVSKPEARETTPRDARG